jgi:hypothetical protein
MVGKAIFKRITRGLYSMVFTTIDSNTERCPAAK